MPHTAKCVLLSVTFVSYPVSTCITMLIHEQDTRRVVFYSAYYGSNSRFDLLWFCCTTNGTKIHNKSNGFQNAKYRYWNAELSKCEGEPNAERYNTKPTACVLSGGWLQVGSDTTHVEPLDRELMSPPTSGRAPTTHMLVRFGISVSCQITRSTRFAQHVGIIKPNPTTNPNRKKINIT